MDSSTIDPPQLVSFIRESAAALGLSQIGVSAVDLSAAEPGLLAWLAKGFHGDMAYMAAHGLRRARPAELVPGTLSVIRHLYPDARRRSRALGVWAAVSGLARVRFLTSHPNFFTPDLLEVVAATPHVCPHIELPVQAGSDAVLAAMRRGYTAAQYRECVARIRARLPAAAVMTDLIVGFPGETEEQFMDTCRLVEELRFDTIHLAKYSPRPGTLAAVAMKDDVPQSEKARRHRMIEALQERIQTEQNDALLDRTVEVLIESAAEKGRWRGRTPQNKLVFCEAPGKQPGDLAQVKIEWAGPFTLVGRAE